MDEAALRAAVEWSVRYLPDFRLPDKALDLVDQACAVVRFATFTPRGDGKSRGETPLGQPGARCSSHRVGVDDIARVAAARCGIPVGTLTADEGARLARDFKRRGAKVAKGRGAILIKPNMI